MNHAFGILALLFSLLGGGTLHAQKLEWAPVGTKWYYEYEVLGMRNYRYGYSIVESVRDTSLTVEHQGQDTLIVGSILRETYYDENGIMMDIPDKVIGDSSLFHLTYEIGNQVWMQYLSGYSGVTHDGAGNPIEPPQKAFMLFDWSLNEGDTIAIKFPFADTVSSKLVEESGDTVINGRSLRYINGDFKFSFVSVSRDSACMFYGDWYHGRTRMIQSIGFEGAFRPYVCPLIVVETHSPLRCFEHPDLGLVNFGYRESCTYALTGRKRNGVASTPMLLNACVTDGNLYFDSKAASGSCSVYDLQGRLQLSSEYQDKLSLPDNMAQGVYIVRIQPRNHSVPAYTRIVVQ